MIGGLKGRLETDPALWNQYSSIEYSRGKLGHHRDKFKELYPTFINGLKKQIQGMLQTIIEKNKADWAKIDPKFTELHAEYAGGVIIREPVFYEFESMIQEAKRLIEFTVRFHLKYYDIPKPKKFSGFMNRCVNYDPRHHDIKKLKALNPALLDVYAMYWPNPVESITNIRGTLVHDEILNRLSEEAKLVYPIKSLDKPKDFHMTPLIFKEKPMDQYAEDLFKTAYDFLNVSMNAIEHEKVIKPTDIEVGKLIYGDSGLIDFAKIKRPLKIEEPTA